MRIQHAAIATELHIYSIMDGDGIIIYQILRYLGQNSTVNSLIENKRQQ